MISSPCFATPRTSTFSAGSEHAFSSFPLLAYMPNLLSLTGYLGIAHYNLNCHNQETEIIGP
jgi:hypothetical protein